MAVRMRAGFTREENAHNVVGPCPAEISIQHFVPPRLGIFGVFNDGDFPYARTVLDPVVKLL
jgi:hypothetical protein